MELRQMIKEYLVFSIKDYKDYNEWNEPEWNELFDKLKYQIRFYSIESAKEADEIGTNSGFRYKHKTFNEYVNEIGDLKKLGPYDYTEFYKNMKDPEFKKKIFNNYEKSEKLTQAKNEIIDYINSKDREPIEMTSLYESFYDYISKNPIEEPVYKNFRDNEFYKIYTLWDMNLLFSFKTHAISAKREGQV